MLSPLRLTLKIDGTKKPVPSWRRRCRYSRVALKGGGVMRHILQEIVLFSCLAAFVTGVVIAAASLFG
jgi:hypothetical protein